MPARAKALAHLYRLSPDDTAVLTVLADTEVLARDFVNAALHMRTLIQLNPANANAVNSLGYAEGFAGESLAAAHDTFERYGQAPNQKGNSLDSWGEILFMHGKFADAEAQFLSAHRANPDLAKGEDLLKAAYSHWLAHDGSTADLKAADAEFAEYLKFRTNQHDPQIAWREASWLGGEHGSPAAGDGELAEVANKRLVATQTAVCKGQIQLPKDLNLLKTRYDATQPFADGQGAAAVRRCVDHVGRRRRKKGRSSRVAQVVADAVVSGRCSARFVGDSGISGIAHCCGHAGALTITAA